MALDLVLVLVFVLVTDRALAVLGHKKDGRLDLFVLFTAVNVLIDSTIPAFPPSLATLKQLWSPDVAGLYYRDEMAVATYAVQVASTIARELQEDLGRQGAIRCGAVASSRPGNMLRISPC